MRMFVPHSDHLEKGGRFRGKDPDGRVNLRLAHHREVTLSVAQS